MSAQRLTARMQASRHDSLQETVTRDVTEHPRDLSRLYCERFQVSRVTANKYIQRLEAEGWLARSGPSTHPIYSPGYRRLVGQSYALAGLDEQTPWERDFEPFFALKPNVRGIVHHGFTEMLNNAIDHSEGQQVYCSMEQTEKRVSLIVVDDGVGIFDKITRALGLPDRRLALLELSKGKLTTDPTRHSGEGVFFTSRMFDRFSIYANDLQYAHRADDVHDLLVDDFNAPAQGTGVMMVIDLASDRTTKAVFDAYTSGPDDFTFDKTVVPLKLARLGTEQLVSRSQAKRLIARFDRFKIVVLDFEGIDSVGQAFADELFRVYARAHPDIKLEPVHMAPDVARMVARARAAS
ncbi:MAG: DUF4325 domain-containing protein [Burkholderiales bacterium]